MHHGREEVRAYLKDWIDAFAHLRIHMETAVGIITRDVPLDRGVEQLDVRVEISAVEELLEPPQNLDVPGLHGRCSMPSFVISQATMRAEPPLLLDHLQRLPNQPEPVVVVEFANCSWHPSGNAIWQPDSVVRT